jgi:uncharacterized protein (DUF983 family)
MPAPILVTCPSCGRRGKAGKLGQPVRCSECGKEFKAGDHGTGRRNFILSILALIAIAIIGYFSVNHARRVEAEEQAKQAEEERKRKAAEVGK